MSGSVCEAMASMESLYTSVNPHPLQRKVDFLLGDLMDV